VPPATSPPIRVGTPQKVPGWAIAENVCGWEASRPLGAAGGSGTAVAHLPCACHYPQAPLRGPLHPIGWLAERHPLHRACGQHRVWKRKRTKVSGLNDLGGTRNGKAPAMAASNTAPPPQLAACPVARLVPALPLCWRTHITFRDSLH
jgi:hypothetical protein